MARTANLQLPLVQASQAQKHVTVNEAFGIVDALSQVTLASMTDQVPPVSVADGTAFAIPSGATGAWSTEVGKIAIASNGGWVYVVPRAGWRGWVSATGKSVLHDGATWVEAAVAVSVHGAASILEVLEVDLTLPPGASVTSANVIPGPCIVFGVTGLVTQAVTGSLSGWRVGVPGGSGRYGSALGLGLGSWVQGLSGQPQAYYTPTPLLLEAEGGSFASGRARLAVHVFRMTVPRP